MYINVEIYVVSKLSMREFLYLQFSSKLPIKKRVIACIFFSNLKIVKKKKKEKRATALLVFFF